MYKRIKKYLMVAVACIMAIGLSLLIGCQAILMKLITSNEFNEDAVFAQVELTIPQDVVLKQKYNFSTSSFSGGGCYGVYEVENAHSLLNEVNKTPLTQKQIEEKLSNFQKAQLYQKWTLSEIPTDWEWAYFFYHSPEDGKDYGTHLLLLYLPDANLLYLYADWD